MLDEEVNRDNERRFEELHSPIINDKVLLVGIDTLARESPAEGVLMSHMQVSSTMTFGR